MLDLETPTFVVYQKYAAQNSPPSEFPNTFVPIHDFGDFDLNFHFNMMDSNSLTLNGGFNFIPEFGVAHSDLSPNLSEITLDGGHSLDYLSNAIPPNDGPQELMNLELSKSTSDMYNYITKELGGFSLEIPGEANTPVNTPVNLEHPFALIPSQVEPSPIFFPPASIETVQPVQQLLQPPLIHRQLHPLPEQLRIPLSSNVVRGHVRSKSLSTLADMQLENSTIFVNRLKKNNVISPPPPPTNNKNIIFAQQSPQPSSIPNPLPHDAVSPVNIVRTQSWSSPMPNLAAVSEEVSSVEKTSGGPLRVVIRKDKSPNTPISASIPSASPRHKENGVLLLPLPPLNVKRKESLSGAELVAKLDVELEKLDFNDVTVTELKDLLRQRGLPSTGKKVLLVERLQKELEQARIRKAARNQTQSSTPVILDSDLLSPSNSSGTESKANFPSRSLSSKTRGVMKHTHSRNKSFSDTRMLARTMRSEENPRMFRKLSSSSPSPLSTSFVTSADYSPQLNFINKPPTIASVMPFEPAQNCMQLDSDLTIPNSAMMNTAEPNSNVFVRVRPLSNEESKRNEVELDWLSSNNNALTKPSSHQPKTFKSFTNVLLKEANNKAVYDTTVSRLIPSVFLGNSACCFCYGHTGSGKTHTILGYDEVGIYRYAIEEICGKLTADTSVQVSFAEIYEDKIYDLLNNRDPLFIREDENGQFLIRSQTTMTAAGEVFVKSLRSVVGRTPSEIFAIVNSGISNRISGSSGVHNQSSRSHAILIFEIVTDSLVKCREDIINAEAKIVPVGKARDGLFIKIQAGRYIKDDNGKYTVNPSYVEIPEDTRMLADLENSVASLQQDIDNAKLAAQNVLQSASPEVGGTLVFVDLAGSEYASDVNAVYAKSAKEKREAKQINQSLLALKECIRRSNDVHVPYRNSKLTMYLKPFLQHKETSFSMIANVSIAKSDEQKILSTLNYADLVAKAV